MSNNRAQALLEALTRSAPRDILLGRGSLSDEELIVQLSRRDIPPTRLQLLSSLSRLLRLMDSLLAGKETGEGFVAKFSDQWLAIRGWEADPLLESEFEDLNSFYSEVQRFCVSPRHREEEPLLFGVDRLKELTQLAYKHLKQTWQQSLTETTNSGR